MKETRTFDNSTYTIVNKFQCKICREKLCEHCGFVQEYTKTGKEYFWVPSNYCLPCGEFFALEPKMTILQRFVVRHKE